MQPAQRGVRLAGKTNASDKLVGALDRIGRLFVESADNHRSLDAIGRQYQHESVLRLAAPANELRRVQLADSVASRGHCRLESSLPAGQVGYVTDDRLAARVELDPGRDHAVEPTEVFKEVPLGLIEHGDRFTVCSPALETREQLVEEADLIGDPVRRCGAGELVARDDEPRRARHDAFALSREPRGVYETGKLSIGEKLETLAQAIEPENRGGRAAEHHGGNERQADDEAKADSVAEPARRCLLHGQLSLSCLQVISRYSRYPPRQ